MSGNISRDAAVRAIMAQKWENGSDGAAALAIVAGAPAAEMQTLAERDATLEKLWEEFGDVPMNPETECMEAPFLDFPAGTFREDIWHWFDERHSKGVAYLMYGGAEPAPREIPAALAVDTPLGALVVKAALDSQHPGVYVDLRRPGTECDLPLALVEFSADDADFIDGDQNIITRVWGNARQEDYTMRTVHQNIEQYFKSEEGN